MKMENLQDSCFNPRTPCGVRPGPLFPLKPGPSSFNPRTPCGVRPNLTSYTPAMRGFQSTHSLRSATWSTLKSGASFPVSIHALLAECDGCPGPRISWLYRFQSTHSLRSATQDQQGLAGLAGCFNPRTPCGVRLRLTIYIVIQQRKRYFAPTSRRRPSSPSLLF